ncbi:hypothetical protein [Sporocytophaga sp.]|nr:hypothetical protein [Sporocytophaga sp.]
MIEPPNTTSIEMKIPGYIIEHIKSDWALSFIQNPLPYQTDRQI